MCCFAAFDFFEVVEKVSEKATYLIYRGWRYLFALRRTRKFIPPPGTRGGVDGTSPVFFIYCSITKQFCLQWKAFELLYKMSYI